jgi:hypothetical protein
VSNDLDAPATKRDLADLRIELKTEMLGLKEDVARLRNSMRWQIVVPSLTLIVSLVIHYIFH